MTMNCSDARALLTDRALGESGAGGVAGLEEHLKGCPACRKEERELEALVEKVDAAPGFGDVEPGPGFYRRLEEVRRAAGKPSTRRQRVHAVSRPFGSGFLWIGLAAAVFVGIVSFALMSLTVPPAPEPPQARTETPVEAPRPEPAPAPPPRAEPPPVPKPQPPAPPRPAVPKPTPEHPPAPAPIPELKSEPAPVPAPKPKPQPAPTRVERVLAVFKETRGRFRLDDRPIREPQKDLAVEPGTSLRADSVTRLVLSEDRVLLLNARARVVLHPGKDRLMISLEQGDLLAELVGPGIDVRVRTRACEIDHRGTVFSVSVRGTRTTVAVEEGRVECRGSKDKADLTAGQQVQATLGRALPAPEPADFRKLGWAGGERAVIGTRFQEEFDAPGAWQADVSDGAAGPKDGRIQLFTPNRAQFQVPPRGRIAIVYRAAQSGEMMLQLHALDPVMNFKIVRKTTGSPEWQRVTVDFTEFYASDLTDKTSRLESGRPIDGILLLAGKDGGGIRVDSVTVVETRRSLSRKETDR